MAGKIFFHKKKRSKLNLADPFQKFQDWFTQQWVILSGRQFGPNDSDWLIGPFGKLGAIDNDFIQHLVANEGLEIQRNTSNGLIPSFTDLNLSASDLSKIPDGAKDFYENTAQYNLNLTIKWNPVFRLMGKLVNILFSQRIKQLNVPTDNLSSSEEITSEIITLTKPNSSDPRYLIWYRTFKSSGQVLYSGIYSTCTLPSGETCVKAVFPLPNGNATVIMSPSVGENGEFILTSSGRKFGNTGFYFLLQDSKGKHWAHYVRSYRDQLIVNSKGGKISAEQILTLWNSKVLSFHYEIERKEPKPGS